MTGAESQFGSTLVGALVIFFVISAGVMSILWMALPFSIFGIKNLLGKVIEDQAKTNEALKAIAEELKNAGKSNKEELVRGKEAVPGNVPTPLNQPKPPETDG